MAAEGFNTAPSGARLPRSTAMPPSGVSGIVEGADHLGAEILGYPARSPRWFGPSRVSASPFQQSVLGQAFITTGRPPA